MIFIDQYDKSIPQKSVFSSCVLATALINLWGIFADAELLNADFLDIENNLRRSLLVGSILIYLIRLMLTTWVFQKRKWTWQETAAISIVMSLALYAFISTGRDNAKAVGVVEVIGLALYLFGSYINTKSEYSRHVWKLNPKNKGKLYTKGLFRYAMHINYLGDVVLFVGLALLTHFSLLAIPAFMMLNFIFNIIPSLDRYLAKKYRDQFVEYAKETKKLIPWIY
jgi:steroid 5-alpha reductase family enzyme